MSRRKSKLVQRAEAMHPFHLLDATERALVSCYDGVDLKGAADACGLTREQALQILRRPLVQSARNHNAYVLSARVMDKEERMRLLTADIRSGKLKGSQKLKAIEILNAMQGSNAPTEIHSLQQIRQITAEIEVGALPLEDRRRLWEIVGPKYSRLQPSPRALAGRGSGDKSGES